jgi:hypothetical protein
MNAFVTFNYSFALYDHLFSSKPASSLVQSTSTAFIDFSPPAPPEPPQSQEQLPALEQSYVCYQEEGSVTAAAENSMIEAPTEEWVFSCLENERWREVHPSWLEELDRFILAEQYRKTSVL